MDNAKPSLEKAMRKAKFTEKDIARNVRRLTRLMDFVAARTNRGGPIERRKFAELYQMLGAAWEYFGLMCRHRDGYKRIRHGKSACNSCGKLKGVPNE